MKIWIFSDLHIEHRTAMPALPDPAPDLVIAAGDISTPLTDSVHRLAQYDLPVAFVPGNHEFYGVVMDAELPLARQLAKDTGVRVLDNDVWVHGGVRILGATLWTDYALQGDVEGAMASAALGLNDHALIRSTEGTIFTPAHALELHRRSVTWLNAVLAEPFAGPTIVVTHHAPHPASVSPKFVGDRLNPAFVSDLSGLIGRHQPELWVHGHTHANSDYRVGKTRVLANPRGYLKRGGGFENAAFDRELLIDVGK